MSSKPLPSRFREKNLERFTLIFRRLVDRHPSALVVDPKDFHLKSSTLAARLRDAKLAIQQGLWRPHKDHGHLLDLLSETTVAERYDKVLIGPKTAIETASTDSLPDVDTPPPLEIDHTAPTLDVLAFLCAARALNRPLLLRINTYDAEYLLLTYDISLTKHNDEFYILQ